MAAAVPGSLGGRRAPSALRIRVRGLGMVVAAAIAAAAAASAFARFGLGFDAVEAAFVAAVLVALGAVDLDRHLLPNGILVPAVSLVAAAELLRDPAAGIDRLVWAAGAFAVFLLLALLYPAGLGMGDVKLVFFLGLALGSSVILALVLGLGAAAVASLAVLARYGVSARKTAIPLGAFLAAGALAALLGPGPA